MAPRKLFLGEFSEATQNIIFLSNSSWILLLLLQNRVLCYKYIERVLEAALKKFLSHVSFSHYLLKKNSRKLFLCICLFMVFVHNLLIWFRRILKGVLCLFKEYHWKTTSSDCKSLSVCHCLLILAVLVLYLTNPNTLHMSDSAGITWFHVFSSISYFTGVFGAMIADSWLGKFK